MARPAAPILGLVNFDARLQVWHARVGYRIPLLQPGSSAHLVSRVTVRAVQGAFAGLPRAV